MYSCICKGDALLTNDNCVLEVVRAHGRGGVGVAVREAGHAHVHHMSSSEWVPLRAAFQHRATTAIGGIGPYENLYHDIASGSVLVLHRYDTTCRWMDVSEWMAIVVHQRRAHLSVRGTRPHPPLPPSIRVSLHRQYA